MNVLTIILIIINIVILVCNIRLIFLTLSGLPASYITYPETDKQYRFAVFIPARNEETCIGRLLDSLAEMDYPDHLKDVYVLLNNCTDRTGEIVQEHGVPVIRCAPEVKNKAGALKAGFDSLAGHSEIDAFVVFDADTVADKAFLKELNKVFAQGHQIVQGKRRGLGLGTNRSWVAQSYEVFYALQNAFFNHPRVRRDLSAAINGSGWAVSRDIIERYGFDTCTITEDIEYSLQNALNGEDIAYCEDAVNYDDFVSDIRRSMRQRVRWSMGNTQCLRHYSGRLLSKARTSSGTNRREALNCYDMLIANMMPVFAAIGIVCITLPIICALCMSVTGTIEGRELALILASPAVAWLMTSLISLMALVKAHISPTKCLKGVLLFPLFVITWFPSLVKSFFRKDVHWAELRKKGHGDK